MTSRTFPLELLHRPAAVPMNGGILCEDQRLLLHSLLRAAETEASALVGATVFAQPGGEALNPDELVFGFEAGRDGSDERILFAIDQSTARALLDRVMLGLAGLRGAGDLTEAESGIVEFAFLAIWDAVLKHTDESHGLFVAELLHGDQCRARALKLGGSGDSFRVMIAGKQGRGLLLRSKVDGVPMTWKSSHLRQSSMLTTSLAVTLALPAMALAQEDLMAIVPGSLILLHTLNDNSAGRDLRIFSGTGWDLADAHVEDFSSSPCVVAATGGPLRPRVPRAPAPKEGSSWFFPVMGEAHLSRLDLENWIAPQTVPFKLDPELPLRLLDADGALAARGEFVCFKGEAAMRVVECWEIINAH